MKLAEFSGEKGIQVVGKLLLPVVNILSNPANAAEVESGNIVEQLSAFFRNNPRDVLEILAITDDKDPATYNINAQEALVKLVSWFDDPELLGLFGLQSQTVTSSGSATTTTEA